jgi:hypothetical protein
VNISSEVARRVLVEIRTFSAINLGVRQAQACTDGVQIHLVFLKSADAPLHASSRQHCQ